MNRDEIWARWSPQGARWSPWVKPVLFAHAGETLDEEPPRPPLQIQALLPPGEPAGDPYRAPPPSARDLAVIVDLPGIESLGAGLALSSLGFQVVPLYNTVPGSSVEPVAFTAVDVWPLVRGLAAAARTLPQADAAAPPAFLLDSRRLTSVPAGHQLDNRSFSSWSDFPTAELLRQGGIRRVMLWGALRWDVAVILGRWQSAGLPLFATDGATSWSLALSFWTRVRHWFERLSFPSTGPGTS